MTFGSFSVILPDPTYGIGLAGQSGSIPGPGYSSVRLKSINPIMRSKGSERNRASHHKWALDISYNEMPREVFDTIYTFLLQYTNSLSPFYVVLPQFAGQIHFGITLGEIVVPSIGFQSNIITVEGTGLSPGEAFTLDEKLYLITRVETNTEYFTPTGQPVVDTEKLHITPAIQTSVDFGANLIFIDPFLRVVLSSSISYSLNKNNLYSLSISVEEAL